MSNDDRRWLALQEALHEKWLAQVFDLFGRANLSPILIKGWAAARLYPADDRRMLGDVDLCVAPAEYEAAHSLLAGWTEKVPVDLHRGFRHLDTLPFEDLLANSRRVEMGGSFIRVLRQEDHLRVLAVHWLNDGGGYKTKLKDIHYAVGNRSADFDWERCLNTVDARRRRWITCAILLAHKYFGTKIDDTPVAAEKPLPEWLIAAVEKEWSDPVRLQPLQYYFRDPKNLWRQLRKRVPPNALQAMIETQGDFDKGNVLLHQLKDVLARVLPSVKRSF